MTEADVVVVTGSQVEAVLAGRREQVADVIRQAYVAHARGEDVLPTASILRFPGRARDRIIALPAQAGRTDAVTGIKWISSFPSNTESGLERASAVILLNSMTTGRVTAVMEGSVISATRTAASAALAAAELHRATGSSVLGLIGCGRINFEILRFLLAVGPAVSSVVVFDQDPARSEAFAQRSAEVEPGLSISVVDAATTVLSACSLVSFATTAVTPWVPDLSACPAGATILHVSLRDIAPDAILSADNVADDVEHVNAARTSVHLAAQQIGHSDFVRTSIGDVLLGRSAPRTGDRRPVIFSPFGLGTLDMALAGLVLTHVEADSLRLKDFWPQPWRAATAARAAHDAASPAR